MLGVPASNFQGRSFHVLFAKVTERRLLGLVPTGESTDAVESQMPVGVKDGVVVHTYVNPSQDPAVKAAVESMWDEYTSGG